MHRIFRISLYGALESVTVFLVYGTLDIVMTLLLLLFVVFVLTACYYRTMYSVLWSAEHFHLMLCFCC